jgi:hypothetical protein
MTTTTIITAVLLSLLLLVAVTFTLQQIEKSNRAKKALIAALKSQNRNFHYLLESFPEGFLGRDLQLLVGQCLSDGLEQLSRLQPRDSPIQQEQRPLNERLAQLQAQPAPQPNSYQPLTDPAQIHEVQKLLNSLYNVVQRLHLNRRLDQARSDHYSRQVQRLATRVALDAHLNSAQQALAGGKLSLAVHHYGLAIDKMNKDNADGVYAAQIIAYRQRKAELEARASQQQEAEAAGSTAVSDEWKNFDDNKDDPWKKKPIYD